MLDLPKSVKIKQPDGTFTDEIPMWSYMALEEGELDVDPHSYRTSKGTEYPVIHVDTESTLVSNKTGDVIHENEMWGFYYKPDVLEMEFKAVHLRMMSLNLLMKLTSTLMVTNLTNFNLVQHLKISLLLLWLFVRSSLTDVMLNTKSKKLAVLVV